MSDKTVINIKLLGENTINSFDSIKKKTPDGIDFWLARELQDLLGYADWDNFKNVIDKAKMTCESTGNEIHHHFGDTTHMIALGKGGKRNVDDVALTRYACYLIAMNGDSSKPQIAEAQTYFAIQTRRQELTDQLGEAEKRLALRDRVKNANVHLTSAAKDCGVTNWAFFQNAGYQGLYGGLGVAEIKQKKGISAKESLLDRIDRAELAANEFRITQTEQKLLRDQIKGERAATDTHREVGAEVRKTIQKIGGITPEELPAASSIKELEKAKRRQFKELKPPTE